MQEQKHYHFLFGYLGQISLFKLMNKT